MKSYKKPKCGKHSGQYKPDGIEDVEATESTDPKKRKSITIWVTFGVFGVSVLIGRDAMIC